MYDVIIVGGGPAGLSAALLLGRCRRNVVVFDGGHPRNVSAPAVNGFLTRDGTPPAEIRRLGRAELNRYGVERIDSEVTEARVLPDGELTRDCPTGFEVKLRDGRRFTSRKLLLAAGVRDILPEVEGIDLYYGRGVFHCPYCDGWEQRDRRLVAYGPEDHAVPLALSLLTWSDRVTVCTDGEPVSAKHRDRLSRNGVLVREEPILRLEGSPEAGSLRRVVFREGPALACDALFFSTAGIQRSSLAKMLGCDGDRNDEIATRGKQRTVVPGLFVAGDADGDVQFVIVAAAEGAKAAVAINVELQKENRR